MSRYAKHRSTMYTGETGRQVRTARELNDLERGWAWTTMGYLLTNGHATMLGLYHLPLPYLCHETGCPPKVAEKVVRFLRSIGWLHYDPDTEFVWVIEMAQHQVLEEGHDALGERDKRVVQIRRIYAALPENPFLHAFFERYGAAFHLDSPRGSAGAELGQKPLFDAPSKGHRKGDAMPGTGAGALPGAAAGQEHVPDPVGSGKPERIVHRGPGGKSKGVLEGDQLRWFNEFWDAFGKKDGKMETVGAWLDLNRTTGIDERTARQIVYAAKAEANRRPQLEQRGNTPIWPQGWLSNCRWMDEALVKKGVVIDEKRLATSQHDEQYARAVGDCRVFGIPGQGANETTAEFIERVRNKVRAEISEQLKTKQPPGAGDAP